MTTKISHHTQKRNGILDEYKDALMEQSDKNPFIVFLCGPSIRNARNDPSARFRKQLRDILTDHEFIVILGEDDGLRDTQIHVGINAQDNELRFISHKCNAVIIIANSVGSFCELGLFSWHLAHNDGVIDRSQTDFIAFLDKKYKRHKNYLNAGPKLAVKAFGAVYYSNFDRFNFAPVIERLRERRSVLTLDGRSIRRRRK